jgi:hypothetical protein
MSGPLGLHGARGLGGPHHLQELGAIAERVVAAGAAGKPEHVVVAELPGMAAATEDLAERGDTGGEAGVCRSVLQAGVLGRAVDRVLIKVLVSDCGSL